MILELMRLLLITAQILQVDCDQKVSAQNSSQKNPL